MADAPSSRARKTEAYHARARLGDGRAAELSRAAHDGNEQGAADEAHASAGDYVKSLVFGGLDGTLTAFAIVSASAGANVPPATVLVLGVANVVADGISMGLGDFVSERAEQEYVRIEHDREAWELDNYPEGEFREMMAIYTSPRFGVSEDDARQMLTVLIKYRGLFLETMTHLELGLLPPDEDAVLWKKGLITCGSFVACGAMPLLAYAVCTPLGWPPGQLFAASVVATAATLSVLGYVKATLVKQAPLKGVATILATGALAASVAYLIGWGSQVFLADLLDARQHHQLLHVVQPPGA